MRGPLPIMTMSPREQSRRVWGAEVADVESEKKSNCTAYGESAKMGRPGLVGVRGLVGGLSEAPEDTVGKGF